MPYYNKRSTDSWYSSIPETQNAPAPESFSADRLKGNEIRNGDVILAKIPYIPGRIGHRNVERDGYVTRYIEFILERRYDSEKRQSRNRRVIIGTDVSHIYRGMMIINDKYHNCFDRDGNLIWQPEPETKAEKVLQQTSSNQAEEPTTPEPESEPETEPAEPETEQASAQATSKAPSSSQKPINEALADVLRQYLEKNRSPKNGETEKKEQGTENRKTGEKNMQEQDDREIQESFDRKAFEEDLLDFMNSVLLHYHYIIEEQTRKKPEKEMSPYQIRRINELLKELKAFFSQTETARFLHLAEEPGEGNPDSSRMTYGDMSILLSAYISTIDKYRMGKLWYRRPANEKKQDAEETES